VSGDAAKRGMGVKAIAKLGELDTAFAELARDVERARGGDPDAAEKARRMLLEIDAAIADVDAELAWPVLDASVRDKVAWAVGWCGQHGTDDERRVLKETIAAIDKARAARDVREMERQRKVVLRLGWVAYCRHPEAWEEQFEHAESRAGQASDLPRATALVRDGRRAMGQRDRAALERVVRELWTILPADAEERMLGYSSGVR